MSPVSGWAQVSSRDNPIAVTSPIPVIATRRSPRPLREHRRRRAGQSHASSVEAADATVRPSRSLTMSGINAGRNWNGTDRPMQAAQARRCHPW